MANNSDRRSFPRRASTREAWGRQVRIADLIKPRPFSAGQKTLLTGHVVLNPERPSYKAGLEVIPARDQESSLQKIVRNAIRATAESVRLGGDPQTPLHALLLEDGLSLGEIAGVVHKSPDDIQLEVLHLVDAGLISVDQSGADALYSIPAVEE